MKRTLSLLLPLGLLAFTACGVMKTPSSSGQGDPTSVVDPSVASLRSRLAMLLQSPPSYAPVLRGNLQAELRLGKEQFSSKINATIRRGELIYWSVVPFPLIEAARVWFTQEGVTAIDRLHGRYAEVSYQELSDLLGFPVRYAEVEQLLLGKPFIPEGARGLQGGAYSASIASDTSAEVTTLLHVNRGKTAGKYLLNWHLAPSFHPTEFAVLHQDGVQKPIFRVSYKTGVDYEAKALPQETALYLSSSSSPLPALRLDWSKVRPYTGNLPDLTPRIKDSYQRMTLPELLKLLSAQ